MLIYWFLILKNSLMAKINKTYMLILLTAMFFLGMSGTDIYLASLPQMVKDFKTTPNVVNYTLFFYNVGIAILVLFAAILSSRYGRKTIIILGISIFSLSAFIISFSPSIWLIIGLRFIQSFGCAFIIIVSRLILKDIMDEHEQIKANGTMLAGLVVSPAVAPVLGAYLAHHFGWRSCFVFSGIIGTLLTVLTFKVLPETNSTPINRLPKLRRYIMDYFILLNDRLLLGVTMIYASAVAVFFSFIGISSYLYIDQLGVSPIMYSYIYIFLAAAYLAGNQYMLALNRRYASYEKIIGIGVYSTMIGALIVLLATLFFSSHSLIAVIITFGVLFMRAANALINPSSQVLILNYFGEKGGHALGLTMFFNYAFMGIAIFLVTLFHSFPFAGLVIVSFMFAFIAVMAFILSKHRIITAGKNESPECDAYSHH